MEPTALGGRGCSWKARSVLTLRFGGLSRTCRKLLSPPPCMLLREVLNSGGDELPWGSRWRMGLSRL